ncbi:hypothetical protein EVAR_43268_1 [Eumeta japonica]|uniref:Uncharacterized protein n=1 Tax=Eumeta variegata TaxID=151549 RepID=A0A4C1WTI3_EUMVA|nr:hypothetical protein EVAR_43268_1 [Eumeta japonica]
MERCTTLFLAEFNKAKLGHTNGWRCVGARSSVAVSSTLVTTFSTISTSSHRLHSCLGSNRLPFDAKANALTLDSHRSQVRRALVGQQAYIHFSQGLFRLYSRRACGRALFAASAAAGAHASIALNAPAPNAETLILSPCEAENLNDLTCDNVKCSSLKRRLLFEYVHSGISIARPSSSRVIKFFPFLVDYWSVRGGLGLVNLSRTGCCPYGVQTAQERGWPSP